MDIRTKKYTAAEFKALKRYENGDIVDLYEHALLLKPAHVEALTEDDWSRYHEIHDELNYELAALACEFGL